MIVLDPGYVAYTPGVELAGGIPVSITLRQEDEFKLTPELLKAAITDKTKAILLNYPCNPTGGFMTRDDYAKIVPILKESGILIVTDEIYGELSYEEEFCSIASFDEIKDQCIVINGFSKAFAMTGWRLGYVLSNPTLSKAMTKIHQYIIMSAPTPAQYGALEGLKHCQSEVEEMRESYRARRNFCVKAFNDMGLETFKPQGAFYVFPCIKSTGLTSDEFCEQLLNDQKIACVPGTAFGEAGEGFIRVSYAYSLEELKYATEKIAEFVNKIRK
jgi:aminotransferase